MKSSMKYYELEKKFPNISFPKAKKMLKSEK